MRIEEVMVAGSPFCSLPIKEERIEEELSEDEKFIDEVIYLMT